MQPLIKNIKLSDSNTVQHLQQLSTGLDSALKLLQNSPAFITFQEVTTFGASLITKGDSFIIAEPSLKSIASWLPLVLFHENVGAFPMMTVPDESVIVRGDTGLLRAA